MKRSICRRRKALPLACLVLLAVAALVTMTACSNDDTDVMPNGGGTTGGGADIDVTSSTPASGNTNISGAGATVTKETFTGTGAGGFDNGVEYTRIKVTATTDGNLRQVLTYFESATGTPKAVSYSWGATDVNENIVYVGGVGLYRLNLASGQLQQISQKPGFHFQALSGDGRYLVDQFSDLATPPITSQFPLKLSHHTAQAPDLEADLTLQRGRSG